jgi:hypothetical protein
VKLLGVEGAQVTEAWHDADFPSAGARSKIGCRTLSVAHGDFQGELASLGSRVGMLIAEAIDRPPKSSVDVKVDRCVADIVVDGETVPVDTVRIGKRFDAVGSVGGLDLCLTGKDWELEGLRLVSLPDSVLSDDDDVEHVDAYVDDSEFMARAKKDRERNSRRLAKSLFCLESESPNRFLGVSSGGRSGSVMLRFGPIPNSPVTTVTTSTTRYRNHQQLAGMLEIAALENGLPAVVHMHFEHHPLMIDGLESPADLYMVGKHTLICGSLGPFGFAVLSSDPNAASLRLTTVPRKDAAALLMESLRRTDGVAQE